MNSPTFNAQFLALDFRMIDNPEFGRFMRSQAFAVYLVLRRYIWRSREHPHPVAKVNELREAGYLVSSLEHRQIARKLDLKDVAEISRYTGILTEMRAVSKVFTGRQNLYILGTWENRSLAPGRTHLVELFYLDQLFGVDSEPQIQLEIMPKEEPSRPEFTGAPKADLGKIAKADMGATAKAALGKKTKADMGDLPDKEYRTPKGKREQQQVKLLLQGFAFSAQQTEEISTSYPIERVQEVLESLRRSGEEKIGNPVGWILAALKNEYEFDSAGKRIAAKHSRLRDLEQQRTVREQAEEAARLETARKVEAWIAGHSPEFRDLVEQERQRWAGKTVGSSEVYLRAQARLRVKEILENEPEGNPAALEPLAFSVRRLRSGNAQAGESQSADLLLTQGRSRTAVLLETVE